MGIVIQERDRELFRELALIMRVADREQISKIVGFGSASRVNARLLALTRHGFLHRFFLGTTAGGAKALYALSAKGAQLVGVPPRGLNRRKDTMLGADYFVTHQLTVNEIYCTLKRDRLPAGVSFERWQALFAPLASGLKLIPDGYVELTTPTGKWAAFLEVDLGHEHGRVWKRKAEQYVQFALSDTPASHPIHRPFRVLVIVPTERRLRSIRTVVNGVTQLIFWFADLESIHRGGLFAPIWLRPEGEERLPLIKEFLSL